MWNELDFIERGKAFKHLVQYSAEVYDKRWAAKRDERRDYGYDGYGDY